MFFLRLCSFYVSCINDPSKTSTENQTLPWHRNDLIAKQSLDLMWEILLRLVLGFRRLRPSQANLSSMSDVYVSPGFNLLPVFWRSLIFLFGSWRRVRGSADPRCVSYRFKLVFCEFSQMRPQLARILRWGTGIVFALAEVTLELTTEIRSVFDIGPGRPGWGQDHVVVAVAAGWGDEAPSQTDNRLLIKEQSANWGKTYKYTGVNLACNVPRQKVNFPACKLPTASPLPPPPPPPPDNRLSSGLVIASFQMEMPVASLLPGSP